jgi:hypothetical protein
MKMTNKLTLTKPKPLIRLINQRIRPSQCPNDEIRMRAIGGPLFLFLEAWHPADSEKLLKCYMLETDIDFYVWAFDWEGRAVWDTCDEEKFDELMAEFEIPIDLIDCWPEFWLDRSTSLKLLRKNKSLILRKEKV